VFENEQDAIKYINANEKFLLSQLEDMEIKTIYKSDSIKINVMREGKKLIKFFNRYGNKEITDIFKEIINLKLI